MGAGYFARRIDPDVLSDGRGGKGKHDIFTAGKVNGQWTEAKALPGKINTALDDFDPVFIPQSNAIIFACETPADSVNLYVSFLEGGRYSSPKPFNDRINASQSWVFGCSINYAEPRVLYFSTHYPEQNQGKTDIYRVNIAEK